jgi:shikimate kinase
VLIGMMGSGKTSVGTLLSERTGWPYLDNDTLLRAASGHTARELAASSERELRSAERRALVDALTAPSPVIIGAAAGVVLESGIDELLHDSFVVWLRAAPATLESRTSSSTHRPWLDTDARAWLDAADADRAPAYRALASMEIGTDLMSPQQVADVIASALAVGKPEARER